MKQPSLKTLCRLLSLVCLTVVLPAGALAEDVIEFLSGAKARGKMVEIRQQAKEFDFEVNLGDRQYTRTYSYAKVHAVTLNGKRFVLNEKPSTTPKGDAQQQPREASTSQGDILKLIEREGGTPPDWFNSTPLNYPRTLDLSWPLKPPTKGWNGQRNVGQYIWDTINPNPGRWRSGIRLVHHAMTRHTNNRELLLRDMRTLGGMYFGLLRDYPRAAFWFRRAGVQEGSMDGVLLAECYWRMGSKKMAMEALNTRSLHPQAIKLLGDMGETQRALQLAEAYARSGRLHEPYLLAGDACRLAGQYPQAISYYQKVLSAGRARNKDYQQRYEGRARESIQAIRLFDQVDVSKVADGVYRASSTAYNGTLEVEVKVAAGRIQSVNVTRHKEKQFFSALTDTPAQIIKKQTVRGIDATSRATVTSQAIVNATAKALAQGAN